MTVYRITDPAHLEEFTSYQRRLVELQERLGAARATMQALEEQMGCWKENWEATAGAYNETVVEATNRGIEIFIPAGTNLTEAKISLNTAYIIEHKIAFLTVETREEQEAEKKRHLIGAGTPKFGGASCH